ncbi:MAG: dihydroorotate dehydrogenase, partial [Myxococcales bacterium]|nr:dihydroorotate dehydrogenase [Myxococcales bacterium]
GLVLFNRFYQPDIDVEALDVETKIHLSHPSELLLRLRWIAILTGKFGGSIAASGGVHDALGALKAVMAGARATQMVSAILREGPGKITEVRDGLARWLEEHEYESLAQAQGSMSLEKVPDPSAFERANYMRMIGSWGR